MSSKSWLDPIATEQEIIENLRELLNIAAGTNSAEGDRHRGLTALSAPKEAHKFLQGQVSDNGQQSG